MNVNEDVWRQVLEMDKGKGKLDEELEDDMSQIDEEEWDEEGQREFVEDSDESDIDDLEDYSGSEFDEFDSDDEGQDFPSDLDVSDEDDEDEEDDEDADEGEDAGSDEDEPKPKKGKGKAPAPAAGSKRKATKEPKRAKRREYWRSLWLTHGPITDSHRCSSRQRRVRDGDRAPFAGDGQQLVDVDGVGVGRADKREVQQLSVYHHHIDSPPAVGCGHDGPTSAAHWVPLHAYIVLSI
jgi:hypothetical protein